MNFIEAVKLLKLDNTTRITRCNKDFQVRVDAVGMFLIDVEIIDDIFVPSIEEILAEDWEVIKAKKLHTFEEALKAYKAGKKITRKCGKFLHTEEYCSFQRDDVIANDWLIIDD